MRFGRFHAVALLTLGLLLLMLQAYVLFETRANVASSSPADQATRTGPDTPFARAHGIDYLPGLVGLGLVAAGGYVLVQRQKKLLEAADARDLETRGLTRHG